MRTQVLAALAAAMVACAPQEPAQAGGEGGSGGSPGCGADAVQQLPGPISLAAAGDLDADGRLDLVVAGESGLAPLHGGPCGILAAGATAFDGRSFTGLAAGPLDGEAGDDVIALDGDGVLHALAGDLGELFSGTPPELARPGPVLGAHLDRDADLDAAVFTRGFAGVRRMENTGTSWEFHLALELPGGIDGVVGGDLDGDGRDELFFLGDGLVEVAGRADFDFSDVRPLAGGVYRAGGVGDLDGDGAPDAIFATDGGVEPWRGDGRGGLEVADSLKVPDPVDLAITGSSPARAVVLGRGGDLTLVGAGGTGRLRILAKLPTGLADPARVFAGDVDGDGAFDAVALDRGGAAFVARGFAGTP